MRHGDPPDSSSHARAKGLTAVGERVEYIAGEMSELRWERGKSAKGLVEIWGVAQSTVEGYAAQASRLVTADEDSARRDISVGCRKLFVEAIKTGKAKDARLVGELWATVSGAKAAERHQVSVGAEPSAAEAARLIREKFGGHAMKDEDAAGDSEPGDPGELPSDPSAT